MKKIGFWLLCCYCLASCTTQYASNDKQQYLVSKNGPNIEVPPPLITSNLSNFYDLATPVGDKKVSIIPPGLQ